MTETTSHIPTDDLIVRYLEGVADADELGALNRRLADDPAARSRFVDVALYERCLAELLPAEQSHAVHETTARSLKFDTLRWVGIAAMITLAVTAWIVLSINSASPQSEDRVEDSQSVALLTNLDHAVFTGATEPMKLGSELHPGTLKLSSGTAQLMFKSGAVVDLTGPCEFSMVGPNRGFLKRGTLSAYVEPRAHGFTIEGPHGVRAVDLGTQFNMTVDALGMMSVRTLEGSVRVDWPIDAFKRRALVLTAGDQVAFEQVNGATRLSLLHDDFDALASLDASGWRHSGLEQAEVESGPSGGRILACQATRGFAKLRQRITRVDLTDGDTLTMAFDVYLPATDDVRQVAEPNGFRFGMYDTPADAPHWTQEQSSGYRVAAGIARASAQIGYEAAGNSLLGGASMPGDRWLGRELADLLSTGQWHHVQMQLARRNGVMHVRLLVDGQIRLDKTNTDADAASSFNEIAFATGQHPACLQLDNITVTLTPYAPNLKTSTTDPPSRGDHDE